MLNSTREIYLNLFRYYYSLKYLGLLNVCRRIIFSHRRRSLNIIDASHAATLAESVKTNLLPQKELELSFFGKTHSFQLENMLWKNQEFSSELGKHWLEKLNSFEWIIEEPYNKLSVKLVSFLILDWITKHKNEHYPAWEPYTLSKRLTAWVKWLNSNDVSPEVCSVLKPSISIQLKRLYVDLELHCPSNHLLENLRGFLAGCTQMVCSSQYFNNELEFQLEEITKEAIKQINKQFLADGAYFERVPMLHIKMTEALSDIREFALNLSQKGFLLPQLIKKLKKLVKLCDAKIENANNWLQKITMQDGFIAQFGDSAKITGIAPDKTAKPQLLEPSGYFINHNEEFSFVLNCGEPAPAFQPGHNHCDILSYELSINNNHCIIDTGCSDFDNETLRQMSRETEGHNLPMVQHQNQSDIWGDYSFGKRAKVIRRNYDQAANMLEIEIEDQFSQRLSRSVAFSPKRIEINDKIQNKRMSGNFISMIHLAPETKIEICLSDDNPTLARCQMTNGKKFSIITEGNLRIDDYISFPEIGKAVGAKVLILSNKDAEALNYVIDW